jgi:hypothetical protein
LVSDILSTQRRQPLKPINRWSPLGQTWPELRFFPVGDLWGGPQKRALEVEASYIKDLQSGIDAYY